MGENRTSSKKGDCFSDDILYAFVRGTLELPAEKEIIKHLSVCQECLLEAKVLIDVETFFEKKKGMRDRISEFEKEIFLKVNELVKIEEGTPILKVMMDDLEKNQIALISKKLNATERIKSLKSALSFPFEVVPLGATRGEVQRGKVYSIGEALIVSIEAPRDGHIAVFHYDSEGNLRLVFPRKKDDVTFAKSKEEKRIGMKVTEPAGKQWLKAVFFGRQVIEPEKICLEEDTTGLAAIEGFLDAIPNLEKDEWMEAEYEFEVLGM
jgi:hypothetical protein